MCESNVWACERVKEVLRHVTHAQGMCLGRSGTYSSYKKVLMISELRMNEKRKTILKVF